MVAIRVKPLEKQRVAMHNTLLLGSESVYRWQETYGRILTPFHDEMRKTTSVGRATDYALQNSS